MLDVYNNTARRLNFTDLEPATATAQVNSTLNDQLPDSIVGQGMRVEDRSKKRGEELSRERNTGQPLGV